MDWGQKLRKRVEDAKQEKLKESDENIKKAKEKLTKFMNSILGEILKNYSDNGLTYFNWNSSTTNRVCIDICSMVGMYGDKAVISAFETIGLKFTVNTIAYDAGDPINSYVISWEK